MGFINSVLGTIGICIASVVAAETIYQLGKRYRVVNYPGQRCQRIHLGEVIRAKINGEETQFCSECGKILTAEEGRRAIEHRQNALIIIRDALKGAIEARRQ